MKLKQLLENPDHINLDNRILGARGSRSFGYYDGKFIVGAEGDFHFNIVVKQGLVSAKKRFEGKIWPNEYIISFWEYPKKNELQKVIKDLEKELKISIWNNSKYQLELPQDKKGNVIPRTERMWNQGKNKSMLIPIRFYVGGKSIDTGEIGQRHVLSPIAKNEPVPSGSGSKKRPTDIRKGETMAQCHFRTRQESKMSKLKDLLPKKFLKEEDTGPWAQQNIKDMNSVTRMVNSLKKHVKETNQELDRLENLWYARRSSTWPSPLENLLLKGNKTGTVYTSMVDARQHLKDIDKWLDEIEKNAGDLLKDISKGKYK